MSAINSIAGGTSVLITGANSGIGKECALQLYLRQDVTRLVLACRNKEKALKTKEELENTQVKPLLNIEILIIELSDLESVRNAVESLSAPVDALIMNAGGLGGSEPGALTSDGVMRTVAINLLGHVAFMDGLVKAKKLRSTAIFAGSEAARGSKVMGIPKTSVKTGSVEEFISMCDGSFYGKGRTHKTPTYSGTKYLAALVMSAQSRVYPDLRVITVSPGHTSGTQVTKKDDLPGVQKFLYNNLVMPFESSMGMAHTVQVAAKRYVDVLYDKETYKTGIFYGSDMERTGNLVDQARFNTDFANQEYQDNANTAIHSFIKN